MIFLREELAPVWKEARLLCLQGTLIFRLSLQHPWLPTPKRHLFLPRTEAPTCRQQQYQLAQPSTLTLLQSFHQPQKRSSKNLRVFRWMTFRPILQKENSGLHGLKCTCQDLASQMEPFLSDSIRLRQTTHFFLHFPSFPHRKSPIGS